MSRHRRQPKEKDIIAKKDGMEFSKEHPFFRDGFTYGLLQRCHGLGCLCLHGWRSVSNAEINLSVTKQNHAKQTVTPFPDRKY
jgi:hypothetical protein